MTTDNLLALYWPDASLDGDDCLDEFLAAGFSLDTIEDWWEAGIATADGAQCLQVAGVRPAQFRMADWVWDPTIIDDLLATLAPVPWASESQDPMAPDTAEIGPYEAAISDTQCTVWNAGTLLAAIDAPSRRQARQRAEQVIHADARQRLPAWERLEPAS